jgi:hypothetical protein
LKDGDAVVAEQDQLAPGGRLRNTSGGGGQQIEIKPPKVNGAASGPTNEHAAGPQVTVDSRYKSVGLPRGPGVDTHDIGWRV